jgi:RNA recognition motif-containing protein
VKSVYLEPIPTSWDGKNIEEICKEYGAIEKIRLYRKSKTGKKKDFAFVEFISRESALNCVEGLNKALVDHGDKKVYIYFSQNMPL